MNNKKEWIVSIRAYACMAVVMIHVIHGWIDSADVSLTVSRFVLDRVLLQLLIRWAVPVFIMISGCLLLDPKRNVPIDKIKKYIKRMVYVLLTFGFGYCVVENIYLYGVNDLYKVIYLSIVNLLQAKSWNVMWYIYLLIGLYIITPLLRNFVKKVSDEELMFTIYGLAIFSLVIPTINTIFKTNITTFYLEKFDFLLIYLLGYAISSKLFSEKKIYILGLVGIIGYLICSLFNIMVENPHGLFIILFSSAIFCFFANGHYKIKNNKIIEIISRDSFGIYLVHSFWLNIFYKGLHIYPNIFPILIGECVFFVIAMLLSVISIEILKRLPSLKEIL